MCIKFSVFFVSKPNMYFLVFLFFIIQNCSKTDPKFRFLSLPLLSLFFFIDSSSLFYIVFKVVGLKDVLKSSCFLKLF